MTDSMTNPTTGSTSGSSSALVSSADVTGTTVYGADGSKIGSIDHVMIDKVSGNIAYAVMNFGGFLGMGTEEHPVPWNALSYDTGRDGYTTGITKDQLEGAPERTENWHTDRDWEDRTYRHYNANPYWI